MAVTKEYPEAPAQAEPSSLAFANTVFAVRGQVREGLETPERLAGWLGDHPLARSLYTGPGSGPGEPAGAVEPVGQAASEQDVARFQELRDAIRTLIRAHIDATRPDAASAKALAVVNAAAALAPSWPELVQDREPGNYRIQNHLSATSPLDTALSTLARDAAALLTGNELELLRACQAPGCVQFFIKDHPRRNWCSPSCGNRARVAKHYARTREQQQQQAPDTRKNES